MCVTFVTCEVRVCGLRCRSGSSLYIYRVYLPGRPRATRHGQSSAPWLRRSTSAAPSKSAPRAGVTHSGRFPRRKRRQRGLVRADSSLAAAAVPWGAAGAIQVAAVPVFWQPEPRVRQLSLAALGCQEQENSALPPPRRRRRVPPDGTIPSDPVSRRLAACPYAGRCHDSRQQQEGSGALPLRPVEARVPVRL